MILKVMTSDGYSIYPGIKRIDFFSAAKTYARCWAVARKEDDPFGEVIYSRIGETDEMQPNPVNFMQAAIPDKGKKSVCLLSAEYDIGGQFDIFTWAFDEAFLMDDAGRTIEHLF